MTNLHQVNLPDIGEGVVEGEVIEWLKSPGDSVRKDEPVVVVMTDKATVELPAPVQGKLAECYYKAGQVAIVGKPLYAIATEETLRQEKPHEIAEKPLILEIETPNKPEKTCTKADHSFALPATRHLAKELGIELDAVSGSGKNGRITEKDLFQAIQSTAPLHEDYTESITGIRKQMMKSMSESKRTIPHFSYFESAEATRLIQLRQKVSEQAEAEGIHLTYMPFFIKALSLTLSKYPKINSSIDPSKALLYLHPHHNIGIAMATEQGLIVPVLKQVEKLSLAEIIYAYETIKQKSQTNSFSPEDMRGGTISISNFGVLGGEGAWATPIIPLPQAAILAIAKITPMPVAVNGQVLVRNKINLSWSFDHRIVDGHLAANVSHYFAQLIQNPAPLL